MIDLSGYAAIGRSAAQPAIEGRLSDALGLVLEARGCNAAIGDVFEVLVPGVAPVEAEVVGLRGDRTLLMPLAPTFGVVAGAPLRRVGRSARARVGDGLLGRVLDGLGRPIDGLPPPRLDAERPLHGVMINPLRRRAVEEPVWVGVRAIDAALTLAKGQRIGIFAGGGVGKSTLLGMMVRESVADVAVIALVGERGREVEEFVHRTLGEAGLAKSVVIAATSADPPLVRVRGALYATAVAEHFREEGRDVLLVMDSVTRYAMAMREIGLAVGEPPTTKGYTPSVFASLPRLLERAGTSTGPGSITGIYTVLVEGDDLSDPIADAARAILDGHIVLSRELAERGRFPAIDVPRSVSRVMSHVASREHVALAQQLRETLASYREAEDLVAVGAYRHGAVPRLDDALARMPKVEKFLRQRVDEPCAAKTTLAALTTLYKEAP